MIQVVLPAPLCELAKLEKALIFLEVPEPLTFDSMLTVLEKQYPALKGKIRDAQTGERRPMVRLFACERDYSHQPLETALPQDVIEGLSPVLVVGAIAGG